MSPISASTTTLKIILINIFDFLRLDAQKIERLSLGTGRL
jgi:hypothetical protein